jgi:hypothetical protein
VKTGPILFSVALVRKILADEKTQTRRLVKPRHVELLEHVDGEGIYIHAKNCPSFCEFGCSGSGFGTNPYGRAGDRLWVREAFALSVRDPDDGLLESERDSKIAEHWDPPVYGADDDQGEWTRTEGGATKTIEPPWKPSIHMPRWASRLTLEVTEVRIERLQDITTDDIIAEGVEVPDVDYSVCDDPRTLRSERDEWARDRWRELWDSINGKRPGASWESNPWVWVIGFRRIEA